MDEQSSCRKIADDLPREEAVVDGRYLLVRRIARGGMASVWEAQDSTLERTVAIKFMASAYVDDDDYRRRFEEEARLAARLRSPYVVHVYDYGVTRGVPFTVMERLLGEDLHERLHRERRLPLPAVAKIANEAGRALRAAHAAGIIHGDLKPKNLYLARHDDAEVVKLVDFGVARREGSESSEARALSLATPFYMSPEQVRGERALDARADLWSLGAILYRALTGVRPFDGDFEEVMARAAHEPPKAPSLVVTDLSPAFDPFFEAALSPQREDRFKDADAFMDAFHSAWLEAQRSFAGVRREPDPQVNIREIEPSAAPPEIDTSPIPGELLEKLTKPRRPSMAPGLRLGTPAALPRVSPPEVPTVPLEDEIDADDLIELLEATALPPVLPARGASGGAEVAVPRQRGFTWVPLGLLVLVVSALAAVIFLLQVAR